MLDHVAMFEQDLRKVVRRGSKSAEFETGILEMSGHYSDIFNELLAEGKSPDSANKEARTRLGDLPSIALQILKSPTLQEKGIRLQRRLLWVPAVASLTLIGFQWMQPNFLSHLYFVYFKYLIVLALVLAAIYGIGVFRAQKLVWKPHLALTLLTAIPLFFMYVNGQGDPDHFHGMTKTQVTQALEEMTAFTRQTSVQEVALRRLTWAEPAQFSKRLAQMKELVEKNPKGLVRMSGSTTGTYWIPTNLKSETGTIRKDYMIVGSTDSLIDAKKKWTQFGGHLLQQRAASRNLTISYEAFLNYKPWPLWYIVYGSILVPSMLTGLFLAIALITFFFARIWLMRGSWFRLVKA